ncbi:unnamed protein product [marine sediment metagenome]|uniref:Uncharacterized protein n=1 Tax=marine sediment metagenome TaxID=412755 RepID=X0VQ87_9ZZZZ
MKIKYGPNEVEADPIEIVTATEPWCIYELADGTKIKVKHVLGAIFRAKNEFTDSNEPLYIIRSQNVVVPFEVPEDLKRKE